MLNEMVLCEELFHTPSGVAFADFITEGHRETWRSNTTTLHDLVEEQLDKISDKIDIRAKADRVFAIASWQDIGSNASLGSKGSDPVGIIATVSQQYCS